MGAIKDNQVPAVDPVAQPLDECCDDQRDGRNNQE